MKIYPENILIVPNSKHAHEFFNLHHELQQKKKFQERKVENFVEMQKNKKYGTISSEYSILIDENYNDKTPPKEFDRAVFNACNSEYVHGNNFTTPAIISRILSGKVSTDNSRHIWKNQLAQIRHSVEKLTKIFLWIDLTGINTKIKKYDDGKQELRAPLLPAHFEKLVEGGKEIEIIVFDGKSPLMEIAESRKQILRYDARLLDVPNQNNTPLTIAVKNYVLRRVVEIMKHKMTPTLTFDDIFDKCDILDADRKTKSRVRELVIEFLNHLKDAGEIISGNEIFAITGVDEPKEIHGKFCSVSFNFLKRKTSSANDEKKAEILDFSDAVKPRPA